MLSPLAASAQGPEDVHPYLTDEFSVSLGVFFPERSFKVGVKDDNWKGGAEQRINGPFVHLSASW